MHDKAPIEGAEAEYAGGYDYEDGPDWLSIARSAYETSTDYLDANFRKQIEKNISNWKSKHPNGSKYYTPTYATRSKLFRPKTRVAVRKNEAAFAAALFSAHDVVILEAEDADDPRKRQDAAYWHEILNYRLTKTIPWFRICVGASQDAQVVGIVCSKQDWEYEEVPTGEEVVVMNPVFPKLPAIDIDGNPILRPAMDVKKDQPRIRLIEINNIRFDPACDWLDPVNSSPYLIECIPMYICDVLDRMELIDPKTGAPEWTPLSAAQVLAYGKDMSMDDDSTARTREGGKQAEADHSVNEFETVWVHENIVRHQGHDYVFYTLSTRHLLSEPVPIEEVYRHGKRPYVIGSAAIEAHRVIPAGTVEMGEGLQAEANDTANQRLDNVKLALNKRYIAKRNSGTDIQSLVRNAPGRVTLTDDPDSIKHEEFNDVTGSAYAEQNRIDADMDDIYGIFSQSSVQTNRQLNETVGGMELMSQSANQNTEYMIRTLVETWVEPVLRQLVLLEQHYEDDEHIKRLALKAVEKKEKKVAQQTGQPMIPVTEGEVAQLPIEDPQNVDVRVNVGFGNLNPDQRVKKLMSGLSVVAKIAPYLMQKIDPEALVDEIFAALGHKNGYRFFTDMSVPEAQPNPEAQIKQAELQLKQAELKMKAQIEQAKVALDREYKMSELALKEKLTMEQIYNKLGFDRERMQQDRELAAAKNLTTLAGVEQKDRELGFKASTGRQGI